MRLLAIICTLLLTTALSALDIATDLPAAEVQKIQAAIKATKEGQSASLVVTDSKGNRIVVAISAIPGATAVVIGDQVYNCQSTADGGITLGQTGKATVAFSAAGAASTVAAKPADTPKTDAEKAAAKEQEAKQTKAIASANAMYAATASALSTTTSNEAALDAIKSTNATTTLQISNGTILSGAQ